MRVKSHQIRAKVAFTKPLTAHLMHGKGDFSRRVGSWCTPTLFDFKTEGQSIYTENLNANCQVKNSIQILAYRGIV